MAGVDAGEGEVFLDGQALDDAAVFGDELDAGASGLETLHLVNGLAVEPDGAGIRVAEYYDQRGCWWVVPERDIHEDVVSDEKTEALRQAEQHFARPGRPTCPARGREP